MYSDKTIQKYFSDENSFRSYSPNNFVLANESALLFPKIFCLIPIEQIKEVQASVFGTRFHFYNGKKITLVTTQHDNIVKAINENKQA